MARPEYFMLDQTFFLSTTGQLTTRHQPQVLGILSSTEPGAHQSALTALRGTHHYWKALRYRSRDRYQGPFVTAVIDYFMDQSGLSFTALVLHTGGAEAPADVHDIRRRYLADRLARLVSGPADIFYKPGLAQGQEPELAGLFSQLVSPTPVLHEDFGHQHMFMQLANLFTGQVWADYTDLPVTNDTKSSLLSHTKSTLSISRFQDLEQVQHPKFTVVKINLS